MTLEAAVAAPFRGAGTDRMGEGEFVVALSLDRDWFSPDQAKRLVDIATGRGLLAAEDGRLVAQFDPAEVHVPPDFAPDESVLREQSTFEKAVDALVAAGVEKREAVAAANRRQRETGVTLEAAAVLVARERGIDVGEVADDARAALFEGGTGGGADDGGTVDDDQDGGDTADGGAGGSNGTADGGASDAGAVDAADPGGAARGDAGGSADDGGSAGGPPSGGAG